MPWWSHQDGLTAHHVGTSARLAVLKAKGLTAVDQRFTHESVIGAAA
jgi:proline racemase